MSNPNVTENRRRKTGDGKPETENRRRETEDGRQKTDFGGPKIEDSSSLLRHGYAKAKCFTCDCG